MDGYRAKIAGTTYFLTGVEDKDYMDRLTAAVNDRIQLVKAASPGISMTEATTLALLNFMHDYFAQSERAQAALAALEKYDPKEAKRLADESFGRPRKKADDGREGDADAGFSSNSKRVLEEAKDRGLTGKKEGRPEQSVENDAPSQTSPSQHKKIQEAKKPERALGHPQEEFDRLNADVYAPVRQRKNRSLSIDPLTGEPRPLSYNKRFDKEIASPGPQEEVAEAAATKPLSAKRSEGYSIDPITGEARKVVKKSRPSRPESDSASANPADAAAPIDRPKAKNGLERERPAGKPKGKRINPFA